MDIKNITDGPKGVNTKSGFVTIEAGQKVTGLELDDAELKSAKATGYFEFGSAAAAKAKSEEK